MTINPDTIEWFLNRELPFTPAVKGMSIDALNNIVVSCTDRELNPRKQSMPHQLEGTAFALYCERALLLFDPRVRKTKTALDWAEHLKSAKLWRPQRSGKGLVIAPSSVIADVWATESSKWSELKTSLIVSDANPRETFARSLDDDTDLIVITWGMLTSMFTIKKLNRKDQPQLYPDREILEMVARDLSLIIIDEIHRCKDQYSLWFEIAEILASKCRWRLGLTGTPVGRFPFSLWGQCYLIDGGETFGYTYQFFEQVFGEKRKDRNRPKGFKYVFDKTKMPILLDKLSTIALTYRLHEVQNVDVTSDVVDLHMRGDQREHYNEIIDRFSHDNLNKEEIKNVFMRMRQVASGFIPYNDDNGKGAIAELECNSKLEWLDDLFNQYDDYPLVIFHEFIRSGEMISTLLKRHKIPHACFNGRDKDRSVVEGFQSGEINVLVCNTRSGGEGINLARAEWLCFYESPCSPIVRKQAESRPLARDRPLLVTDLVCAPVEQRILDMIAQGRDLQHAVMSDRDALWHRV